MEIVNRLGTPLVELYKSMTPGARLAMAALVVVISVSLAYTVSDQVAEGRTYLMGGETFSAAQLRSMQAALGKAGLAAEIDAGRIQVARGQEPKAMAALAESGALPVEFNGYLEKAVSSSSWMSLGRNQTAAMKVYRQRELQNIIDTMVEKSAVLIDEHTDDGFPPKTTLTASVSVWPKAAEPLEDSRIPAAICRIMLRSIAGLKPQDVSVIDLSTGRAFSGTLGTETSSAAVLSEYADVKRYYEREYQQTVTRALAYIPGILVTASVELAPPAAGSQVSLDAIRSGAAMAATPRRVAVSISVPSGYYEKIWRQSHPRATAKALPRPHSADLAEMQAVERRKIEQLVAPLLPRAADAAEVSSVAVSTFEQPSDHLAENARWAQALAWATRNQRPLGIGALVLVGLVALRSVVRSLTAAPSQPGVELGSGMLADEPRESLPTASAREQLIRRFDAGGSLSEELADAVREDPRAAVSILRNWIGQAG
jgi:flagellar biosynthesis/type III secretory pathway M-ring protein FliF/YscJ